MARILGLGHFSFFCEIGQGWLLVGARTNIFGASPNEPTGQF